MTQKTRKSKTPPKSQSRLGQPTSKHKRVKPFAVSVHYSFTVNATSGDTAAAQAVALAELPSSYLLDTFVITDIHQIENRNISAEVDGTPATVAKLNFQDATKELNRLGLVIRRHAGEYRVNFRNGEESTAYYTESLEDAYNTGRKMAEQRAEKHTEEDLTTILAALRYWQEQTQEEDRESTMPDHFADVRPLEDAEIDELCEALNCGDLELYSPIMQESLPAPRSKTWTVEDHSEDASPSALIAAPSNHQIATPPNATPFLIMRDNDDHTVTAPCGCVLEPRGGTGAALYQCERHERANGYVFASEQQIDEARDLYHSDEINIDSDARISHGQDGVWIEGWLWVQDSDLSPTGKPRGEV